MPASSPTRVTGGNGATPAITPTSATTLGNFLFVEISYDTFGGTQTGWTPPTGWIGITPVNVGGKNADGNVACFYYPNAPAISTAQTFTPVGTSVVLNANIVTFQEFSGVPTNATLDTAIGTGGQVNFSGSANGPYTLTAAAPTATGELTIAVLAIEYSNTITVVTGYTAGPELTIGSTITAATWWTTGSSSAPSAAYQYSGNQGNTYQLIAFRSTGLQLVQRHPRPVRQSLLLAPTRS